MALKPVLLGSWSAPLQIKLDAKVKLYRNRPYKGEGKSVEIKLMHQILFPLIR